MKKIMLFLFFIILLSSCSKKEYQVSNIQASSYIVIEQSTNKILEGINYDESRSVASISKIMTAIVTIENIDINKIVKVPDDITKVYGSSIYLKVNQEISILDLLYGLMLRSGNDAAITLAVNVAGSVDRFVKLMNEMAIKLELKGTYFNNPHGLDEQDGGNISTSYDMAILYSYCLKNEVFAKITATKQHLNYVNKNRLLRNYSYCTGGKTGFTKKAKRTLVTSASKDNINLIIVTLNCGNDFLSHQNIYEKYFSSHKAIKIINKGENEFANHSFISDYEYYFITDQNNLHLYYVINEKEKYVDVYLYNSENRIIDYTQICIK